MSTRRETAGWFGVVNLNKPVGWTSRQAVDHVKRLVKPAKIGHAGTLDPLARGVLLLCLGPATRLVPYLHDLPKTYRAEFLFGRSSPTDDTEVEVDVLPEAPILTRQQIEAALPQFVGSISQVPPAYSAVKLHGRRAYDLARRGKTPVIEPRTVQVHAIRLLSWNDPRLELEIICGSGTYIRSIGRDLARSLGSAAVMCGLTRTQIGLFSLDHSVAPEDVTPRSLPQCIAPPQTTLPTMPQFTADTKMLDRLQRGLRCECPAGFDGSAGNELAVLNEDHQLVLIATIIDEDRVLQPRQVFLPKSGPPGHQE